METREITSEKQTLLKRLRESERKLAGAADVPEDHAKICPEAGSWSVLDVVEHITLSDRRMLQRFKDASLNTSPVHLEMDGFIENIGRDLSSKMQAPLPVLPVGQFTTLADALQHYRATRAEIVVLVESSDEDFRKKLVQHPILKEMDGYQLFLLVAAHSERHAQQIEAVKRSDAYRAATRREAGNIAS